MKTDKELLELAAKAAGIECDEAGPFVELREWQSEFGTSIGGSFELVRQNWEPLTDDGDALRLAVKMKLGVVTYSEDECCCVWAYGMPDVKVKYDKDPYAATRLAIVRAAAAIGEKL